MLWILIALAVFVYIVVAGGVYNLAELHHRRNCKNKYGPCASELRGSTGGHSDIEFAWFGAGVLWPFILPVSLGLRMTKNGLPSKENRRAAELATKQHELALAKLEMEKSELSPKEYRY